MVFDIRLINITLFQIIESELNVSNITLKDNANTKFIIA